jgi:hypothetical protein
MIGTLTRLRTPLGTIRQPTAEECAFVGRETIYSAPFDWSDYRELGDYVIECRDLADGDDDLKAFAELCERFAIGDAVHIIPAGLYIEE